MKVIINSIDRSDIIHINIPHSVKVVGTSHLTYKQFYNTAGTRISEAGVFMESVYSGSYEYFKPSKIIVSEVPRDIHDQYPWTNVNIIENRGLATYEATEWVSTPSGISPDVVSNNKLVAHEGSLWTCNTDYTKEPPSLGADWTYIRKDSALAIFDTTQDNYSLWDAGDNYINAGDNGVKLRIFVTPGKEVSLSHFVSNSVTVIEFDSAGGQLATHSLWTGGGNGEDQHTSKFTPGNSTVSAEIFIEKNTSDKAGLFNVSSIEEHDLGQEVFPYDYNIVDSSLREKNPDTGIIDEKYVIKEESLEVVTYYPLSELQQKKDTGAAIVGGVSLYILEDDTGKEVFSMLGYIEKYDIHVAGCTQATTSLRVTGFGDAIGGKKGDLAQGGCGTIPEGLINDNTITTTNVWSSSKVDSMIVPGAVIDDTVTATDKVWSSSKVVSETAIIQVPSNGNGQGIKMPDGTMMLWGTVTSTYSDTGEAIDMPASFIDTNYSITASCGVGTSGAAETAAFEVYAVSASTFKNKGVFVKNHIGASVLFNWIAIGRWK